MSRRAALAAVAALALAGCGTAQHAAGPTGPPTDSWVPGQGSLALAPAYLAIAGPADAQGDARHAAYERRLELIAARQAAAKRKARQDALRRYRLERARALAKYRAAVRKAKLAAERARRRAERLRRLAAERLKKLLAKLRVPAGRECEVPEVAREFDCVSGRLPLGKRKKR